MFENSQRYFKATQHYLHRFDLLLSYFILLNVSLLWQNISNALLLTFIEYNDNTFTKIKFYPPVVGMLLEKINIKFMICGLMGSSFKVVSLIHTNVLQGKHKTERAGVWDSEYYISYHIHVFASYTTNYVIKHHCCMHNL